MGNSLYAESDITNSPLASPAVSPIRSPKKMNLLWFNKFILEESELENLKEELENLKEDLENLKEENKNLKKQVNFLRDKIQFNNF
jgi:hypothetical protein